MNENSFRVFDLETRIVEDDDGSLLNQICASLRDELAEVKREINAGLTPEDFQAATQFALALETASDVLTKVWKREHPVSAEIPIIP